MEGDDPVTRALDELGRGESAAADRLLPMVYDELRTLADRYLRRERSGHTLQATALVHEVYLRLVGQERANWQGRTHFMAVGAEAMRRVLIDHARSRGRQKRGGDRSRVTLTGLELEGRDDAAEAAALSDALERLNELDPQQARIVRLRFFAGLSVDETAALLELPKRTVERNWAHARAWLARELA